jgi:hypothetical protein
MEDPDFARTMGDNAAVAVGKLRDFGDKYFRHATRLQPFER